MMETAIFKALADPSRRAVFERLASREMTVAELTEGAGISQPAISQHLASLRAAGLVRERRKGRNAYYRQAPEGLAPLADWIDRYRAFWPEKIEALKNMIKDMNQ